MLRGLCAVGMAGLYIHRQKNGKSLKDRAVQKVVSSYMLQVCHSEAVLC